MSPPTPVTLVRRLGICLEADPFTLGWVTGTDATMRGANTWIAGTNTTKAVDAANLTMTLTRTGSTGAASATFTSAVGSVRASRDQIIWVILSPDGATNRTATITATWRSSGGSSLGTSAVTRTEGQANVRDGRTYIGLIAPSPASTSYAELTISIAGCLVNEIHHVHHATGDYAGIDVRTRLQDWRCGGGRNETLSLHEATTADYTLLNLDGYLTPDGMTAPAPYLGNIDSGQRVFDTVTVDGILYPVWSGYTVDWTQAIPGAGFSTVRLHCDDGFYHFTGIDLESPYVAQVMLENPLAFYPLDESAGSRYVGNRSGVGGVVPLLASTAGSAATLGSASVMPVLAGGGTADGGASSISFASSNATQGDVVNLSSAPGMVPVVGGWAVEFWFSRDEIPAATEVIFRHAVAGVPFDFLSGFQIDIPDTGNLRVLTGSETVYESQKNVCDGVGHHVVVAYRTGGTHGTVDVHLDGGSAAMLSGSEGTTFVLGSDPTPAGDPNVCQFGGIINTSTAELAAPFRGTGGMIIFHGSALTSAKIAAHYFTGSGRYIAETEYERITRIVGFTPWPIADTDLMPGASQLQPAQWAAGKALSPLQGVATSATGELFMNAHGWLTYRSRRYRSNAPAATTLDRSIRRDLVPEKVAAALENVVEASQRGGATVVVVDQASVTRRGRRKGEAVELAVINTNEPTDYATFRLLQRGTPKAGVRTLSFRPAYWTHLYPLILRSCLADRIQVTGLPALAPAGTVDGFLERVEHSGRGVDWVTQISMSPWTEEVYSNWARLDDPVYGQLDAGNRLAY